MLVAITSTQEVFKSKKVGMEVPEVATQLAETRPKFDTALRISIPVNTPARCAKLSRDAITRINAFSPSSYAVGRQLIHTFNDGGNVDIILSNMNDSLEVNLENDSTTRNIIKDYTVVAASSKRAGKKDVEATAYVSLGITCDNQGKLKEGLEYYMKYLQICEEIGDAMGCACACNCLGVSYMLLASPPTDLGILQGVLKTEIARQRLESAIFYHSKHLEIGPDAGGNFVAHSNLGLTLGMLNDVVKAAQHHQDALRIAIKMQSLYGQSIAVGNLGSLALMKEDLPTARTCFEQVCIISFFLLLIFINMKYSNL